MKWLERLVIAQVALVALLLGFAFWRQTTAGLSWNLTHGDRERRSAALVALGRMGPRAGSALPLVVPFMSDPDDRLQIEAAHAVGEIGGTEALAFVLKSPDARARWRAAEALRSRPDRRTALPALHAALHDESALVRRAVVEAIGACVPRSPDVDRDLAELVRSDPDADVAIAALFSIRDPPDAAVLRLALQSAQSRVRRLALERLAQSDALAIPDLVAVAKSDGDDAPYAIERLGYMAGRYPEEVRPLLLQALKDPSPRIRAAAATALGQAYGEEAFPILRDLVNNETDFAVRSAAWNALHDRHARRR
jgi:HEAT repeats